MALCHKTQGSKFFWNDIFSIRPNATGEWEKYMEAGEQEVFPEPEIKRPSITHSLLVRTQSQFS